MLWICIILMWNRIFGSGSGNSISKFKKIPIFFFNQNMILKIMIDFVIYKLIIRILIDKKSNIPFLKNNIRFLYFWWIVFLLPDSATQIHFPISRYGSWSSYTTLLKIDVYKYDFQYCRVHSFLFIQNNYRLYYWYEVLNCNLWNIIKFSFFQRKMSAWNWKYIIFYLMVREVWET